MENRSQPTRQILIEEYTKASEGKAISFATTRDIIVALRTLNPRTVAGFLLLQNVTSNQAWHGEYFPRWPGQDLDTLAYAVTWMELVENNERVETKTN